MTVDFLHSAEEVILKNRSYSQRKVRIFYNKLNSNSLVIYINNCLSVASFLQLLKFPPLVFPLGPDRKEKKVVYCMNEIRY